MSDDLESAEGEAADVLAASVADAFAMEVLVTAVAWSGSRTGGLAGPDSDIDLYVYAGQEVPSAFRAALAARFAGPHGPVELDNRFWGPGDEWRDAETGIWVDIVYRTPAEIEDELTKVLDRHEARTGYTTCFWYNVLHARPLFDGAGWFRRLHERAAQPYPDGLRRAVVAMNQPILAAIHSSYRTQIGLALARDDRVSVSHRLAALLASYFDVLFALNREPHPGEKRLLAYAEATCPLRPLELTVRVDALLGAAAGDGEELLARIDGLVADLDALLEQAGLLL